MPEGYSRTRYSPTAYEEAQLPGNPTQCLPLFRFAGSSCRNLQRYTSPHLIEGLRRMMSTQLSLAALLLSPDDAAVLRFALIGTAIVIGFTFLVVRSYVLGERRWKNRPERLCTNCLTIAQPLLTRAGVWYCPQCHADNPAPSDSPFARDSSTRSSSVRHD